MKEACSPAGDCVFILCLTIVRLCYGIVGSTCLVMVPVTIVTLLTLSVCVLLSQLLQMAGPE